MIAHPGPQRLRAGYFRVLFTVAACAVVVGSAHAAPFNIGPDGDAILGAGADTLGTDDVPLQNSGSIIEINDQDVASPGPFNIRIGRSIDSYGSPGGATGSAFDFVGVLFDAPQNNVNSVRVQNFAANDGGWWGASLPTQNGIPLAASDLAAPEVQVTTNGGTTWTTVASTTDYVNAYTGVVRGTGVPTSGAGPLVAFNFAAQNGINGIRLIGDAGGEADGNGFIGVIEMEVLQDAGLVFPTLNINTATGAMTLNTGAGTARGVQGYKISSDPSVGGLNAANWLSVADNYDTGHPGANQIDTNDQWTELTGTITQLAESQFAGDGGQLSASKSIPLGNIWRPNPFGEDIRMEVLLTDGRTRRVDVTYNGASENPLVVGDFNFDGDITGADWPSVRDNFNANLSGLSGAQGYLLGDINGDGVNDRFDFAQFKTVYDAANGAGAFQAMVNASVPEPSSLAAMLIGAALFMGSSRRNSSGR